MKKILFTLVIAVSLLVILAQRDDALSEEAKNLINRIDANGSSESYLHLYGIFAEKSENPVSIGKHLLEEYRKVDIDELYEINDYPDSKKITLPEGVEFCRSWEEGCFEQMFSASVNVNSLLAEHKVLVSRSDKFLEFDEYTTLSKPTILERFPPYHYFSAAERIKVIQAISIYRNGDVQKAIDLLLAQFSNLRRSLALQDNLVGKLIFLMKLSEVMDVLSVILSNEDINIGMIPNLNEVEKDFYMIAAREFSVPYYTFKNLDKHPEFFEKDGDFPKWVSRILFKPNMTVNAKTPIYSGLEKSAQLSPSEFAKKVEKNETFHPSTSKIRNYLGDKLISISPPDFDVFVARFFDFETKIALFNQFHHFKYDLKAMKNPYYGSEIPEKSGSKFCFSGPIEDERSLRCLRVEL